MADGSSEVIGLWSGAGGVKILILGINYAPEPVGIGPYTEGMATALAAAGHRVSAVVAKPYYPGWKIDSGHAGGGWRGSVEDGVALLRCPLYVPAQPSGAKRLLHHASFALSALLPMLRRARRERPDVVLTVAPSLIAAPLALLAGRIAGARSWLHVQDLEVEAAFATGLLEENRRWGRSARRFEATVLRGFDRVSTISPQMCAALRAKGLPADKVIEFRNWASTALIVPLDRPSSYAAEWNIATRHVALYSGNIANKQGIEIVIDAARRLRHRGDLTFVICGEGPNRSRLEESAADLANVRFHALQPRERLGDLLGLASVHLLPQIGGAADLVLPSKLSNMLASGRPVVAGAAPGTGLFEEVRGCGTAVPPEDAEAFASAIERLIDDDAERGALGRMARMRAERRWEKSAILGRFERQLTELAARGIKPGAEPLQQPRRLGPTRAIMVGMTGFQQTSRNKR